VRAYAYDLLALYRWLADTERTLDALTQADLLDFIAQARKRNLQPKSINRALTTIRSYYYFSTGFRLDQAKGAALPGACYKTTRRDRQLGLFVIRNPVHRQLRVKEPKNLVEPLDREQVRLFLRTLNRYRDIAIVELMLMCGLRSREVLNLEIKSCNFDRREIRIPGKGQKQRMVPLPDSLVSTLEKYLSLERPKACGHTNSSWSYRAHDTAVK
jgi:site-specific recombinase XerD